MYNENTSLLKQVASFDLILSLIFISIGYFIFGKACLFFMLGIGIALINLLVNSLVLNISVKENNSMSKIILMLSQIYRILIVSLVAAYIVNRSTINFLIFIAGYTSQIISLILYGFKAKQ
ncbi:hypothetical protein [Clostridium sp. UBA6640]|uniref:hypothetical protein n=1 Tax=Clostridium sp. UBA6640 TaxID=1946370 RepID=UPI0025C6E721|nr:hypothetical protein [Clostridium sp. UBA6640]